MEIDKRLYNAIKAGVPSDEAMENVFELLPGISDEARETITADVRQFAAEFGAEAVVLRVHEDAPDAECSESWQRMAQGMTKLGEGMRAVSDAAWKAVAMNEYQMKRKGQAAVTKLTAHDMEPKEWFALYAAAVAVFGVVVDGIKAKEDMIPIDHPCFDDLMKAVDNVHVSIFGR